jgi:hypothetical protein
VPQAKALDCFYFGCSDKYAYARDSCVRRFADLGIIPDTRRRLSFDERWPGVLENNLNASGQRTRVIEDSLKWSPHSLGRSIQTWSQWLARARTTCRDSFSAGSRHFDARYERFSVLPPIQRRLVGGPGNGCASESDPDSADRARYASASNLACVSTTNSHTARK